MSIEKAFLASMKGGWFIGHFSPTLQDTETVEVAIKRYRAGDLEAAHFHKVATEYTVIISGEVEMSGKRYLRDDILIIRPGVATDFRAITDVVTAVVKLPGAPDDKYFVDPASC